MASLFDNPSTWFQDTFMGAGQTRDAINSQSDATRAANETQRYMYDTTRSDLQPWREAGVSGLDAIQREMPDLTRKFTMSDFTADPGYQFRMAEGTKALERSAAAGGGINSGRTMKALTRFGQDLASQEYGNAYNRFNTDQDKRFNKLSSLAGIGQSATSQLGQAGQNYANQVSGNQIGMGNANAAAYIAQANRQNALLTGGMQGGSQLGAAYLMSDRNVKKNIKIISKEDIRELRENLKPYKFQYINEELGTGEWVGVMAQDLEKSKLGRTVVFEDDRGHKAIDMKKLSSLLLAMMAEG